MGSTEQYSGSTVRPVQQITVVKYLFRKRPTSRGGDSASGMSPPDRQFFSLLLPASLGLLTFVLFYYTVTEISVAAQLTAGHKETDLDIYAKDLKSSVCNV